MEPKDPINLSITLPVEWEGLNDIAVGMANTFLGQATPHEIIINFSCASPPMFTKAPSKEDIANIKSIKVRAMARIGIPVSRMPELIKMLNEVYGIALQQQQVVSKQQH